MRRAAPGWGKGARQRPCATRRGRTACSSLTWNHAASSPSCRMCAIAHPTGGDGGGGGLMMMSVVVPTYNRLPILTKCLRALEAQHLEGEFEVLVVDDGSTDGTVDFLRGHAASFPHVRLLVQVRVRAH